jgi:hypothetical protein
MKRFLSLFLAGAALAPAVLSADTFEGKVTMTLTMAGAGSGPHAITYSTKNNLVRIDTDAGPHGSASIILDTAKQQMTILMPQQSMYMVRPIPMPTGPETGAQGQSAGFQFTKTAETAKLLGYDCVKYTVQSADGTTELWVTDQLGTFAGFGGGMGGRQGQTSASWEDAIKGKNFFPLKVIATHNGTEMRMEATAVQKESLPDSDFVPPAGWKDIGAMMQGMMPGGRPPGN